MIVEKTNYQKRPPQLALGRALVIRGKEGAALCSWTGQCDPDEAAEAWAWAYRVATKTTSRLSGRVERMSRREGVRCLFEQGTRQRRIDLLRIDGQV